MATDLVNTRDCWKCSKPMGAEGGNRHSKCLERTTYKIRVGRKWLKSLVCKPGGAVLTDSEADAGLFEGPVRDRRDHIKYGPATETGLTRNLLGYEGMVWCKPAKGPGFWMW